MGLNLTNQYIDETFQKLTQISGSFLTNGTGSVITELTLSASNAQHASTADSAATATTAVSASYAFNSTQAISASYATNAGSATTAVSASTSLFANSAGSSLTATSASHALNADNSISSSYAVSATSSSFSNVSISSSYATTADTSISSSHSVNADNAIASQTSISSSHALNADNAVSSSHSLNADNAINAINSLTSSKVTDTNIAYKNENNVFTGTQTFDTITATSASFSYVQTVTGSAVIVGEQYIILNADSPTQRFAGIQVYDSGSFTTGSFEWDSVDDNWIQVKTNGQSGGILTGVHGTKGAEAYPSNNTLLKGTGTESVGDSIVTDDGSKVTVAGQFQASGITGSLNGNVTGNASTATTASYAETANTLTAGDKTIVGMLSINGVDTLDPIISATGSSYLNGNVYVNQGNVDINTGQFFGRRLEVTNRIRLETGDNKHSLYSDGELQLENTNAANYHGLSLALESQGVNNSSSIDIWTPAFPGATFGVPNQQIVFQRGDTYTDGTITFPNPVVINGSSTFNNNTITNGSVTVNGRASSSVNTITVIGAGTSTIDCSVGNMFTIALNASTTLTATNVTPGQTISVRVINSGTNTMAFDTMFDFSGGTAPTITPTGTDILTFISFDGTTLFSTAVQNLS